MYLAVSAGVVIQKDSLRRAPVGILITLPGSNARKAEDKISKALDEI